MMIQFKKKGKVVKHSMSPIFLLFYHTNKKAFPSQWESSICILPNQKQYPLSSLPVLLQYLYSRHGILYSNHSVKRLKIHFIRKEKIAQNNLFIFTKKKNTQQNNECIGVSFNHQDLISFCIVQQSLDFRARSIHVNQNF